MEKTGRESIRYWYVEIYNIITVLVMTASFAWIWYRDLNPLLYTRFLLKGNFIIIGIYMLAVIMFLKTFGSFKINVYNKTNILISQFIALLCASMVQMFLVFILIGRVAMIMPILLSFSKMFAFQLIFSLVFIILVMSVYYKVFQPYDVLLIYGKDDNVLLYINNQQHNYRIKEKLRYDDASLMEVLLKYRHVIVSDVPEPLLSEILKECFMKGKKLYFRPTISNIIVNSSKYVHLQDTPLYFSRDKAFTIPERVVKRCGDILISLIGIIITSPIMILTALAVFLCDFGPIFYKQARYTYNGKIFKIIKFRSMIKNAEEDGNARLATENDNRITPVGRFIRACRIDELPQFFNVLKGDMSIVGPRPERPEIADKYMKETPEFIYRLKVKAGLTGYAQVYGKYNTTYTDKLLLDMIYVEKCSIILDIMLILLTLKVIFQKESAEGLEKEKTNALKK